MPEVIFTGTAGKLEGRYTHGKSDKSPTALILHPHPQRGGSMNNRVVYTTYQTFAKNGFSVLRFNFRGVGKSQGQYDKGEGELNDAISALEWLQNYNPHADSFWIAGFSFGAWIALQLLMRRPELTNFVTIAPPVNMYDFSFLSPCPVTGLIIHGDKDDVVPESASAKLAQKLSAQKGIDITYKTIKGANHFFKDKDLMIEEIITNHIKAKSSK